MLTSGSLFVPRCWARGMLSYCSQTPWLQSSKTIAQNIVFASTSEVDEEADGGGNGDGGWYDAVIKACALDVDLRGIRGGDGALAGGLSGGQKARVALARAVYSRKPVVILDDVFAALDNRTSEMVFDALLGEGGLLRGKTVVVATNKLSQLRHADWIITLREGGAATQGRYNETGDLSGCIFENQVTSAKAVSEQGKQQREVVENVDDDITPIDGIDKLETGSVNWQTYLHYIRAVGWPRILIYAVLLFITIVIQTVTPVYLQIWSAYNDERRDEPSTGQALAKFLGGYFAFEIAYSISLSVLFYYVIMAVSLRASTNLHAMQFSALVRAPLSFFDTTQVGQIISRFSQDIFIIDDAFPIALYDLGFQGAKAFGSTILMIVSVPYLTVVVILVVVLAYFVQRFYLATSKQLRRLDMASKSPLYTLFQETIQFDGLLTIRAGSSEDYLTNINSSLLLRSQKPFYLTNISSAWLASTIGLMTALVNTSIVILAVATRRSTNAGLLAVGLTQAVSLQDVISLMMTSWTQMEISIVAVERNLEYCKLEPEEKDGGNGAELPGPEWPICGDVAVENLFAQYAAGSEPVLRGVSFHAQQGSKLAICGRTGSGKSTILMALVHALCVQGNISIDGVDILQVPRRVLRQNITVVLQDPFVLDGTFRENVDVGGDSTDKDIWSALEAVQLKSAVAAFDDQLDHELRSSGHQLSQGQMQLLSLARAMLRGNKILILDEATGNLDAETDDVIQNVIRTRFAEATVIAIAHRTSTIADYDHVLFLEDGVVVESGLPGTLLRDGNRLSNVKP